MGSNSVSIIIPVWKDADPLKRLLAELVILNPQPEVIVVQTEEDVPFSADPVWEKNLMVLRAPKGRGSQMNAGARAASGDVFLFLHADSILMHGFWESFHDWLEHAHVVMGGCFRFSLPHATGFWPRLYEIMVWIRVNGLNLPYGDQGFFIRRLAWNQAGPFRDWPLMEDLEWWRRAGRKIRLKKLSIPLGTSSRRFERRGWGKSAIRNLSILTLYLLGTKPETLKKLYT